LGATYLLAGTEETEPMAHPSSREIAETQREAALGTTQQLIQEQASRNTNPPMTGSSMRPVLIGMGLLVLVGILLFGIGWPLVQKGIALLFAKLGLA
jgi:hypothetical protein